MNKRLICANPILSIIIKLFLFSVTCILHDYEPSRSLHVRVQGSITQNENVVLSKEKYNRLSYVVERMIPGILIKYYKTFIFC